MTRAKAILVALSVLVAAGCGAARPGPVDLGGEWPTEPGDFETVTETWTRSGSLRSSIEDNATQLLEVQATLRSPAWRSAYVEWWAARADLEPDARNALMAEQRAAADEHVEVVLVVTTYHREHNDLQRGDRSIWRLALEDGDGSQVPAESVVRDRRPREVIAAEVPEVPDFAEVYIARFPNSPPLFSPERERLTLRMASNLGAVELSWDGR